MRKNANKSGKNSSCSIISKTPQGFFGSVLANDHFNILLAGRKPIVIKAAQKVFDGILLPIVLSTEDLIEINKNPDHNVSENEKDIATKIMRLRKKQKKLK